MKYIKVAIDNNTRHTDSLYTYKADDDIRTGQLITVPFGRGNSLKRAVVMGIDDNPSVDESKIKQIVSTDGDISLSEEMISTALWMRQRYGIKYFDAVRCFIPPGKPAKEGKEKRPLKDNAGEVQNIEALTPEQYNAYTKIADALTSSEQKSFLLHGITGSGKTEVYMQAAAKAIDQGKTVIMLVPEIALTKQILDRFIGRFGRDKVAVMHSRLTGRERFDEWQRIRSGEAKIVVGARMAVFAPLENIGLIIMDEEHETSYKADMSPKYETVDIAMKRAISSGATIVLGSATPSVISYSRAKRGIYTLLELSKRYNGVELPEIETVDMLEELRSGNRGIFSRRLIEAMKTTLDAGEQIILFLNRRGYSTSIKCKQCGNTMKCPDCGINLTYHKNVNSAVCHYCGKHYNIPQACTECGSEYMKFTGVGTEQIEEEIKKLFPNNTSERLDLDSIKTRGAAEKIITKFAKGKTDILIGTQLVAKGLDFRNVGLVGVVSADTSLNIPDYRASERTFQLITQVAGRAGRGNKKGHVIVQTYDPENFAVRGAVENDYKGFYGTEDQYRRLMDYPPYSDLILVEFVHSESGVTETAATACREYILSKHISDNDEDIFNPKKADIFKGKKGNKFKVNLLIKSRSGLRNEYMYYLSRFVEKQMQITADISILIDVNPYSIY